MIYLDNAATGGFKPRSVTDAVENSIRFLSANPGRSGHKLSVEGARTVYDCRCLLGEYFSCTPENVIFTKNCTEALNLAIFGTKRKGGHVITTVFEHNSVLRPLYYLKNKGVITLDVVCPTTSTSLAQEIQSKIKANTYMVIANAVSNVTGQALPIKEIGEVCRKFDLLFVVDGAQGGGHVSLDMKANNISLLALATHKGLYGIMGSGALLIDDQTQVEPITFGGTGSESFNLYQPRCYPERLESGTLNLPAISALREGVLFVKEHAENFSTHLLSQTTHLINGLSKISKARCYSTPNPSGIVAFSLSNLPSEQVADVLSSEFDIALRGGMHCAPLMHKFLQTEKDGLNRVSLAVQNTSAEIDYLIKAVNEISKR